jgi:predicted transglutaminase-like cysteine proteinase
MKIKAIVLIAILMISSISFIVGFNSINIINPDNPIKKIDTDGDGFYDQIDAFPDDPSASLDTDNDGYPDYWNEGKNQDDSTTNLRIDAFPRDPAASFDTDGDGFPDYWNEGKDQSDSTSIPPLELDEFPNDPNSHKDTDKDGYPDFYDIYDYANLSIEINIEKFKLTKRIDALRWGQVYFDVYINNNKIKTLNNNNKYWWVFLNIQKKISHDPIIFDIPDNTKKEFTEIKITAYDFDLFKTDDKIDISEKRGQDYLIINFDNGKNEISDVGYSEGEYGKIWYEISHTESDIQESDTYNRSYRWNFKGRQWLFSEEISVDLYEAYVNSGVSRVPQSENAMASFVTSNDEVINIFSNKLKSFSDSRGYNTVTRANFILKFVQQTIIYKADNKSKGKIEYWRFPVETLVDKVGDCEDTSVLYASIMDNLGYDVVLLLYSWEEDNKKFGHLAVGIHLNGDHGSYVIGNNGKKYFYCETTTSSFNIGSLPSNIEGDPDRIIQI